MKCEDRVKILRQVKKKIPPQMLFLGFIKLKIQRRMEAKAEEFEDNNYSQDICAATYLE